MAAPEISVVIPTFERAAALEGCLDALASQTLERERFEVIVCDDGSRTPVTIPTRTGKAVAAGRFAVRIERQANAGPAAARNRGAAVAAGRYLAFTDDDCRPAPDWLERLLATFERMPDALIGGGLRTTSRSDRYAQATQAIMDFVYAEQEQRDGMRLFSTSNLALPRKGFAALGGFSTSFPWAAGEDYDLCARWYHAGGQVVYAPEAVVVHDHALTLPTYWRQHFSYGRGLLRMRQRLRGRGVDVERERGNGVPGRYHLRLVLSPLSRLGLPGVGSAVLIALSQAATAAGAVREILLPDAAASNRDPHRPATRPR